MALVGLLVVKKTIWAPKYTDLRKYATQKKNVKMWSTCAAKRHHFFSRHALRERVLDNERVYTNDRGKTERGGQISPSVWGIFQKSHKFLLGPIVPQTPNLAPKSECGGPIKGRVVEGWSRY